MQEGDARAADADPRGLVDELHAAVLERLQRLLDVVGLVGDVMDAGAALGQEPADGRVRAQRRQQLHVVLADVQQDGLDALLGHRLAVDERHGVGALVKGDRRVEVLDGDTHVIDAREHSARDHISMDVAASPSLRLVVALAAAALAALALAACGSEDAPEPTPAQRLAQPGRTWRALADDDRVATMRTCRLEGAVAAAKDGAIRSAPYFSGRYDAVQGVTGPDLRKALDRWFAGGRHGEQSIGRGCAAVVGRLVDLGRLARRARADFASPVTVAHHALRLVVGGDR